MTLSVGDLDRSLSFYRDVLAFRPLARWKYGAYLLAGDAWWCLSLDSLTRSEPRAEYTHIALSVDPADFLVLAARIHRHALIWKENRSEGESVYFLDPDGHKLEIHISDWRSRLSNCRQNPYEDMEFFDLSSTPQTLGHG